MTQPAPITLTGAPGSPYTRKMLSVLRYRRIPYRYLQSGSEAAAHLPRPKVQLLPTFYLPDDGGELQAVVDSTPIIRRLERDIQGRSVIPGDPALAFLDELIEDYGDEWLTKAMFHYRWAYADDIAKAGHVLPAWRNAAVPDAVLDQMAKAISERQISRLYVVGSNPVTGPVIEASYRRFLEIFEAHLSEHRFILGGRPASCDFAVFGQLTQLAAFDPTPMALTAQLAPRVLAWVGTMEDLSGAEPDADSWIDPARLPPTLTALLTEIGRVYPPVMLANAQAVRDGAAEVQTTVDGLPWTQQPFPYQAKCLEWLRASHVRLSAQDRQVVDGILKSAGLEPMFT